MPTPSKVDKNCMSSICTTQLNWLERNMSNLMHGNDDDDDEEEDKLQ